MMILHLAGQTLKQGYEMKSSDPDYKQFQTANGWTHHLGDKTENSTF